MLKCYKVLSKRKVLYIQFITVSMSKLRNITPPPCQLVIWEQGTGIIWSSIGFKLNKEIFLSLMASFEVIPPVSRSPMQCFWSKCSPLALAMAWCAPDNIYWGRKLRGAAKTRGWCRTTSDPPSPSDCCNIALGFKEHIQWKQILQLGFITFFVNRLPDQTESRSWIRKSGGKVNIIIYHFTLSNTDGGINNFVSSNYLQNLAFEKHRYNSEVLKITKYSKISKISAFRFWMH